MRDEGCGMWMRMRTGAVWRLLRGTPEVPGIWKPPALAGTGCRRDGEHRGRDGELGALTSVNLCKSTPVGFAEGTSTKMVNFE